MVQRHVDLRLRAGQEYLRRIRNFQRQVLDVNLLDTEYWLLLLRFILFGFRLVEGRGYKSSGLATQQRLELAGTIEGR